MDTSHQPSPTGSTVSRLWTVVGDELRERRREREARRRLHRELATYSTPTDVDDLLAALEGHDDPASEEIRSILTGNLSRRAHSGQLAG